MPSVITRDEGQMHCSRIVRAASECCGPQVVLFVLGLDSLLLCLLFDFFYTGTLTVPRHIDPLYWSLMIVLNNKFSVFDEGVRALAVLCFFYFETSIFLCILT